ncbi:hypothetical protein OUZ56_024488 [Daphnia magna]|uniref:Uncharacterized protein n=1 Tax=Daphnia magna TaxID=35525 RepID=A0ABR0B0W1_9CRUS|nr:hypothetical protein OUZ56_024488 [Daphnia magna]
MKTAFASRLTVTLLFSVCYCDILDTPSTGRMSSAQVAWFLSPSQDGLTRQNTTYLTGFLILRDMDTLIFDQDKKNLKICGLLHFSRHGYRDFGSRAQDLNVVEVNRRGDRVVKQWFYGVMVSTSDSDSDNLSSKIPEVKLRRMQTTGTMAAKWLNSVDIDFGVQFPKLSMRTVHGFVRSLKVDAQDLLGIVAVLDTRNQVARITFMSEAYTSSFLSQHSGIVRTELEGKEVSVVIKDSNIQEKFVRIAGIPQNLDLGVVQTRLKEFGNVIEARWERCGWQRMKFYILS